MDAAFGIHVFNKSRQAVRKAMKIRRAFLVAILMLSLAVSATAQTAEEIIAKAVKAMGGEDALRAVETSRVIGRFSVPDYGISVPLEVLSKRPNKKKIMLELEGQQFIRCTNSTVAWQVNPLAGIMEPTPLDAYTTELFNVTSDSNIFFFDLEEHGIAAELVGLEEVEGEQLNHVHYTFPSGHNFDLYFNPETGLPRLSVVNYSNPETGEQVIARTFFSDYRPAGGLVVAHREDDYEGAQHTIVEIVSVEANVEIDDSVFEMPAEQAEK
jgi:hypothetical protein